MTTQNNNVEGWEDEYEKKWCEGEFSWNGKIENGFSAVRLKNFIRSLLASHTASIEAKYREGLKDRIGKLPVVLVAAILEEEKGAYIKKDLVLDLINNNQK